MIEVERKFSLQSGDKERLIEGAQLISRKENKDTYYDQANYSLTTKDIWLRNRNEVFELKVSINAIKKQSERKTDQYKEITDENEIREILHIPVQAGLEQDLASHGYTPYGSWITVRTEYSKDGFIIDFDEVDFGLNMIEIELMVPDESAVLEANEKIVAFAKQHNLTFTPISGKNTEYLRRFKPEHYQALVAAEIV